MQIPTNKEREKKKKEGRKKGRETGHFNQITFLLQRCLWVSLFLSSLELTNQASWELISVSKLSLEPFLSFIKFVCYQ
jgi:hypothetical protein